MEEPGKGQSGGELRRSVGRNVSGVDGRDRRCAAPRLRKRGLRGLLADTPRTNCGGCGRLGWRRGWVRRKPFQERPSPVPPTMRQAQTVPERPSPLPPAPGQQDVTALAAQAYLACIAGGFRYWSRMGNPGSPITARVVSVRPQAHRGRAQKNSGHWSTRPGLKSGRPASCRCRKLACCRHRWRS